MISLLAISKHFPVFFTPKRLLIPTNLTFTPAFITTTMMQNYSQRVTCDMPSICLMFVLFAYSYTAFLMVDSFAASPFHSWDFCEKKALRNKLSLTDYWRARKCFMKLVKPFSSHCLTTEEPELLKTLFIGQWLHSQMQNISASKFQLQACTESNFSR